MMTFVSSTTRISVAGSLLSAGGALAFKRQCECIRLTHINAPCGSLNAGKEGVPLVLPLLVKRDWDNRRDRFTITLNDDVITMRYNLINEMGKPSTRIRHLHGPFNHTAHLGAYRSQHVLRFRSRCRGSLSRKWAVGSRR